MNILNSIINNHSVSFTGLKPEVKAFGSTGRNSAAVEKDRGNAFLKINELDKAIACYKKSVELSPDYTDAYFNLGKAYFLQKKYSEAANAFEKVRKLAPNDAEALVLLGESYKNNGYYKKSIEIFNEALRVDNTSDYAKRNYKEAENYSYAIFNLEKAYQQKKSQATKNLDDAINMAKKFLPSGYLKDMSDLTVAFDDTSEMGGRSNIAQYEHYKRKITVTADYIWANPKLVAAYLVHEFVHAKDNDPYTSIYEEQDAYVEAAKFWSSKIGMTKDSVRTSDPEMDYVVELYNKSPESLRTRVAEIYKLRDPGIAKTSPNHPPNSKLGATGLSNMNAQSLKHYDIIA